MKTPYAYLSKQVDDLYDSGLKRNLSKNSEINEFCDFIRNFIEANGWDVDDYTRVMMGFEIMSN